MFGAPKLTAQLSIPRILEVAWKLDAQPSLYDQLIPLVESSEERCKLGKKYQRHRIVIDVIQDCINLTEFEWTKITISHRFQVLTSFKDRMGLLKYRDALTDRGDVDYVNNILRVSVINFVISLKFEIVFYMVNDINLLFMTEYPMEELI